MNAITAEPLTHVLNVLRHIERALTFAPANPRFLIHRAQCLLALGRPREACRSAAAARRCASAEPALLDAIGTVFSQANDHRQALAAYNQAISLSPDNPLFLFNRAAVCRYLGKLDDAEQDYDRVIALRPDDYEAYKNRADLRTQTRDNNHIATLEALLAKGSTVWAGEVELRYALAKEYEDIGEYARSFQHLRSGSRLRREHLRYDVSTDVATATWVSEAFPGPLPKASYGCSDAAPIFIVGLPRSGSTVVERILSSHSAVRSAGELPHFALALVDGVRRQSGLPQMPRKELVSRSASLDFAALGHDYLARARASSIETTRFIDKMPLNYLYCGLIQRALPNARIVHVTRNPMAACYAIFKTLFKDGYPFSYDLAELAQYYAAYRRLMQHWESTMQGNIYVLRYEDLVADQGGTTRKLLEFCGLEWEDACAEFHRNPAPTTTASASQVRRRMYDTSVSQWRNYEVQLAPLREYLCAAGIACDE